MDQLTFSDDLIRAIEMTFDMELYPHQKEYLKHGSYMGAERRIGKTTAFCIKLALSQGPPLNLNRPEEFSDYGDGSKTYARYFFVHEFLKIRQRLLEVGFPVRAVRK